MSRENTTGTNRSNGASSASSRKSLVATPVKGGSSGVGLPYAPEDWPLPGDKWRWKVSRRTTLNGYFHDRFLIPPPRFPKSKIPGLKGLSSKLLAEQFVRKEIPGADLEEFWGSFIWRIPSSGVNLDKGAEKRVNLSTCSKSSQANGHVECIEPSDSGDCKVGNKMCHLRVQARKDPFPSMPCDICCSESGFCRDCSCILCGGIIDSAHGGYSFIRCMAIVENEGEKFICGHVGHVNCALRAYLAGTVGGNFALDAEYYCRRCDNRTDLVSYLTDVLNSTKSINCQVDVEKILSLGSCLLRGSQKLEARQLLISIERMLAKLRDGFKLEEIWKIEDDVWIEPSEEACPMDDEIVLLGTENGTCYPKSFDTLKHNATNGLESCYSGTTSDDPRLVSSDSKTASLEHFENAVDDALRELRKSQESEYRLAEEKLYAQKNLLLGLYQELEAGRTGVACPAGLPDGSDSEGWTSDHNSRVSQIRREEAKLQVMMHISKGYGSTPKDILTGLFQLPVDG